MTKLYLGRTVNSFLKDIRHDTEDELHDVINRNISEFQNEDRVGSNLNFIDAERDIGVIDELILICLTESDDYIATGSQLDASLEQLEERIVADSHDNDYISSTIPDFAGRVYSAVLSAA